MWARAQAGQAHTKFRPVGAIADGAVAPATFARSNGDVAVFNYAPLERDVSIDLREAGLGIQPGRKLADFSCVEIWTNASLPVASVEGVPTIKLRVAALSSALVECRESSWGAATSY